MLQPRTAKIPQTGKNGGHDSWTMAARRKLLISG
jgi:hypothetical protein